MFASSDASTSDTPSVSLNASVTPLMIICESTPEEFANACLILLIDFKVLSVFLAFVEIQKLIFFTSLGFSSEINLIS